VIELIWITSTHPGETAPAQDNGPLAGTGNRKLRLPLTAGKTLRRRDLVELRIFGARKISILLRNTKVGRGEWRDEKGLAEDKSKIQELWRDILMRQRQARREFMSVSKHRT
jgi:hypothetical protein